MPAERRCDSSWARTLWSRRGRERQQQERERLDRENREQERRAARTGPALCAEPFSWLRRSQNVVSIRPLVVSGRVVSRLIKSGPVKAGEVAFVASSCVASRHIKAGKRAPRGALFLLRQSTTGPGRNYPRAPRHNQGKHLIVAQRQSNLKLSDNQKSGVKKILANCDNQHDHDFATGRRFKLRLPPFSSRLSRNTGPGVLAEHHKEQRRIALDCDVCSRRNLAGSRSTRLQSIRM
jgi:hypothetical protein